MRNGYIGLAILGTVAIAMPGAALAQTCPPGQILQGSVCRVATMPGAPAAAPTTAPPVAATTTVPPVRTTTTTTTATARPSAVAPTTTAPATGIAGSSTPPATASAEKAESCPSGFSLYNHGCYPAQDAASAMMR